MDYSRLSNGKVKLPINTYLTLREFSSKQDKTFISVPADISFINTVMSVVSQTSVAPVFRGIDRRTLMGAVTLWRDYVASMASSVVVQTTASTAPSTKSDDDVSNMAESGSIVASGAVKSSGLSGFNITLFGPSNPAVAPLAAELRSAGMSDEDVSRFLQGMVDLYASSSSLKSAADAVFSARLSMYKLNANFLAEVARHLGDIDAIGDLVNKLQDLYSLFALGSPVQNVVQTIEDRLMSCPLFEFGRFLISEFNSTFGSACVSRRRVSVEEEIDGDFLSAVESSDVPKAVRDILFKPFYREDIVAGHVIARLKTGYTSESEDCAFLPSDAFSYFDLWSLIFTLKRRWLGLSNSSYLSPGSTGATPSITAADLVQRIVSGTSLTSPEMPEAIVASPSPTLAGLACRFFKHRFYVNCFTKQTSMFSSKIRSIMDERKYLRDERFEIVLSETLDVGNAVIDAYCGMISDLRTLAQSTEIFWDIDSVIKDRLDVFLGKMDEIGKTYTLSSDHPRALHELSLLSLAADEGSTADVSVAWPDSTSTSARWLLNPVDESTVAYFCNTVLRGSWFNVETSDGKYPRLAINYSCLQSPSYLLTRDFENDWDMFADVSSLLSLVPLHYITDSGFSDTLLQTGDLVTIRSAEDVSKRFNVTPQVALSLYAQMHRMVVAGVATSATVLFHQHQPKIYVFADAANLPIYELGNEPEFVGQERALFLYPALSSARMNGITTERTSISFYSVNPSAGTRSEERREATETRDRTLVEERTEDMGTEAMSNMPERKTEYTAEKDLKNKLES